MDAPLRPACDGRGGGTCAPALRSRASLRNRCSPMMPSDAHAGAYTALRVSSSGPRRLLSLRLQRRLALRLFALQVIIDFLRRHPLKCVPCRRLLCNHRLLAFDVRGVRCELPAPLQPRMRTSRTSISAGERPSNGSSSSSTKLVPRIASLICGNPRRTLSATAARRPVRYTCRQARGAIAQAHPRLDKRGLWLWLWCALWPRLVAVPLPGGHLVVALLCNPVAHHAPVARRRVSDERPPLRRVGRCVRKADPVGLLPPLQRLRSVAKCRALPGKQHAAQLVLHLGLFQRPRTLRLECRKQRTASARRRWSRFVAAHAHAPRARHRLAPWQRRLQAAEARAAACCCCSAAVRRARLAAAPLHLAAAHA